VLERILATIVLLATPLIVMASKADGLPMPLGEQLPVELVATQNGINVEILNNAGLDLMVPMLGSGLNRAAARNAEARVGPINQALSAYRYGERFEARLRASLASEGISPAPVLTVHSLQDSARSRDVPLHALVLTPQYTMSQDFDRLYVRLHVQLVDREPKADGQYKARARATRIYMFSHRLKETKVEQHVAAWHSLPPPVLAALLDEAIGHVIDMMVYDFSAEGRAEWDANVRNGRARLDGHVYGGKEVRRGEGWIWLRSGAPAQILMQRVVVNPAPFKMGINGFRVIDPVELAKRVDPVPAAAQATEQVPSADPVPEQP
jgi:hypothetical protein